jgi:hypothetical protein
MMYASNSAMRMGWSSRVDSEVVTVELMPMMGERDAMVKLFERIELDKPTPVVLWVHTDEGALTLPFLVRPNVGGLEQSCLVGLVFVLHRSLAGGVRLQ